MKQYWHPFPTVSEVARMQQSHYPPPADLFGFFGDDEEARWIASGTDETFEEWQASESDRWMASLFADDNAAPSGRFVEIPLSTVLNAAAKMGDLPSMPR